MVFYTIVYRLFGPLEFVVLGCISGQPLLGLGGDPVLTQWTRPPTDSTANREGVAGGQALFCTIARRNLDGNGGPVISFVGSFQVRNRRNVWSSGWDTGGDCEDILEVCSRVRNIKLLDLFLVSGDLALVHCDLFLEN